MTPEERVRVIETRWTFGVYVGECPVCCPNTQQEADFVAKHIRQAIAEAVAEERGSIVPLLRECRAAVDVLSEYAIKAGVFGVTKTRQGLYGRIDAIIGNVPEEPTNAE